MQVAHPHVGSEQSEGAAPHTSRRVEQEKSNSCPLFSREESLLKFSKGNGEDRQGMGFLGHFVKISHIILLNMTCAFQPRVRKQPWKTRPWEAGRTEPEPSSVPSLCGWPPQAFSSLSENGSRPSRQLVLAPGSLNSHQGTNPSHGNCLNNC